jgi:hypothetical protein
LTKEIVDHSIVHRALLEHICMANKSSVTDTIQRVAELLVQMIHTRDGSKVGSLCIIYIGAKEKSEDCEGNERARSKDCFMMNMVVGSSRAFLVSLMTLVLFISLSSVS